LIFFLTIVATLTNLVGVARYGGKSRGDFTALASLFFNVLLFAFQRFTRSAMKHFPEGDTLPNFPAHLAHRAHESEKSEYAKGKSLLPPR